MRRVEYSSNQINEAMTRCLDSTSGIKLARAIHQHYCNKSKGGDKHQFTKNEIISFMFFTHKYKGSLIEAVLVGIDNTTIFN